MLGVHRQQLPRQKRSREERETKTRTPPLPERTRVTPQCCKVCFGKYATPSKKTTQNSESCSTERETRRSQVRYGDSSEQPCFASPCGCPQCGTPLPPLPQGRSRQPPRCSASPGALPQLQTAHALFSHLLCVPGDVIPFITHSDY